MSLQCSNQDLEVFIPCWHSSPGRGSSCCVVWIHTRSSATPVNSQMDHTLWQKQLRNCICMWQCLGYLQNSTGFIFSSSSIITQHINSIILHNTMRNSSTMNNYVQQQKEICPAPQASIVGIATPIVQCGQQSKVKS